MTAVSVLTKSRNLLSVPTNWTQETMARDADGVPCKPEEEKAKCFCIMGSLRRVVDLTTKEGQNAYGEAVRLIKAQCGKQHPIDFNDSHGHRAVMKMLGRAIAAARAGA